MRFSWGVVVAGLVGACGEGTSVVVGAGDAQVAPAADGGLFYAGESPRSCGVGEAPLPSLIGFDTAIDEGLWATDIAVADLDGDGMADVLAATASGVSLRRGARDARLVPSGEWLCGLQAGMVRIGDLDGDGRLDAAVLTAADHSLHLLLGDGKSLREGPAFVLPGRPIGFALGDLDGDGRLDVLVAYETIAGGEGHLRAMLGRGGGFVDGVDRLTSGHLPGTLAVGDFNGDHRADVFVLSGPWGVWRTAVAQVFLGDGHGGLTPGGTARYGGDGHSSTPVVADLDGDGRDDVVLPGVWIPTTDPAYSQPTGFFFGRADGSLDIDFAPSGIGVALLDLDGDGKSELLVGDQQEGLRAFHVGSVTPDSPGRVLVSTKPAGEWAAPPLNALAVGDVDGDGRPDVVTSGRLSVFRNVGGGRLEGAARLDVQRGIPFAFDVDGDRHPDLVTWVPDGHNEHLCYVAGGVFVARSDGKGHFGAPTRVDPGPFPARVMPIDLDGDGVLDLVSASAGNHVGCSTPHSDPPSIGVLLGDNQGGFAARRITPLGVYPTDMTIGDVNGDGHPDVILTVARTSTPEVDVFLDDSHGNLSAGPTTALSPGTDPYNNPIDARCVAADIDGDGRVDLACINEGSTTRLQSPSTLTLRAGQGDGRFSAAQVLTDGVFAWILAADIDGDGRADLLASRTSGAFPTVILLRSGAALAPVELPLPVDHLLIADMNNDGHPDLIGSSSDSQPLTILLGDGHGAFHPAAILYPGEGPLAAADFNSDGKTDLLSTSGALFLRH